MNIRDQWLTLVEQVYFLGVSVSTLGSERERVVSQMSSIEHIPFDDARNGTRSDELPISLRED